MKHTNVTKIAVALLLALSVPATAQIDTGGVHIGPGGVVVKKRGQTTVIDNGGVRIAPRRGRPIVRRVGRSFVINTNNARRTIAVNGGTIVVNGNSNSLTLTGVIGSLTVNGNQNQVHVSGRLQSVVASGNRNIVTWTRKSRPSINSSGTDNQLVGAH